jgi:hypothetical protein
MDASVGDWLGVYSKGNNVTATAPIKYQYCHEDPKYISTGELPSSVWACYQML